MARIFQNITKELDDTIDKKKSGKSSKKGVSNKNKEKTIVKVKEKPEKESRNIIVIRKETAQKNAGLGDPDNSGSAPKSSSSMKLGVPMDMTVISAELSYKSNPINVDEDGDGGEEFKEAEDFSRYAFTKAEVHPNPDKAEKSDGSQSELSRKLEKIGRDIEATNLRRISEEEAAIKQIDSVISAYFPSEVEVVNKSSTADSDGHLYRQRRKSLSKVRHFEVFLSHDDYFILIFVINFLLLILSYLQKYLKIEGRGQGMKSHFKRLQRATKFLPLFYKRACNR